MSTTTPATYGTFNSTHELWEPIHRMRRCGKGTAAAYTLILLGQMTGNWAAAERMVLLALAHHFDTATWSPNGYNGTRPEDLVLFTGMAAGTVGGKLRRLADRGWCMREKRGNAYIYRPLHQAQEW